MNLNDAWREYERLKRLVAELRDQPEGLDPQEAKDRRQAIGTDLQRLKKIAHSHTQGDCPPAFADACVLMDDTRCPYYHDGQCVKAEEAKA